VWTWSNSLEDSLTFGGGAGNFSAFALCTLSGNHRSTFIQKRKSSIASAVELAVMFLSS
jgi:hypothetical protein